MPKTRSEWPSVRARLPVPNITYLGIFAKNTSGFDERGWVRRRGKSTAIGVADASCNTKTRRASRQEGQDLSVRQVVTYEHDCKRALTVKCWSLKLGRHLPRELWDRVAARNATRAVAKKGKRLESGSWEIHPFPQSPVQCPTAIL